MGARDLGDSWNYCCCPGNFSQSQDTCLSPSIFKPEQTMHGGTKPQLRKDLVYIAGTQTQVISLTSQNRPLHLIRLTSFAHPSSYGGVRFYCIISMVQTRKLRLYEISCLVQKHSYDVITQDLSHARLRRLHTLATYTLPERSW